MNRWVYRRPLFRAHKPKIPLTRLVGGVQVRRRRYFARRRHVIHGKVAAAIAALVFTAQAGHTVAPRRRVFFRAPQRVGPRDKIILPRTPDGKQGPIRRMLKAVSRMRRQMQARLRWKPRPEFVPPISVPNLGHADNRGSVFSAGAVVADVYSAGSKRGSVYGDG